MILRKIILILIAIICLNMICFCEKNGDKDNDEKLFYSNIIERDDYKVILKQYAKEYPIALYVVYKEYTPFISEIQKTLRKELLTISKTIDKNTVVIASAWFDDQISDELEKIELSTRNSAFVWVGAEEKTIKTFPDYIKYLKDKIAKDKEQEKSAVQNSKQ